MHDDVCLRVPAAISRQKRGLLGGKAGRLSLEAASMDVLPSVAYTNKHASAPVVVRAGSEAGEAP